MTATLSKIVSCLARHEKGPDTFLHRALSLPCLEPGGAGVNSARGLQIPTISRDCRERVPSPCWAVLPGVPIPARDEPYQILGRRLHRGGKPAYIVEISIGTHQEECESLYIFSILRDCLQIKNSAARHDIGRHGNQVAPQKGRSWGLKVTCAGTAGGPLATDRNISPCLVNEFMPVLFFLPIFFTSLFCLKNLNTNRP